MKSKGIEVSVVASVAGYRGVAPMGRPYLLGACPEYAAKQVESDASSVVQRYIPAQEGRGFSIVVVNESANDVSCVFFVDGQMANCLLCYAPPKYNSITCYGVEPRPGRLRKFVFRKAVLIGFPPLDYPLANAKEDEDGRTVGRSNEELGVIRVVVRRCIPISYDAAATIMHFNSRSPIDEKSQKGLLDIRTELKPEEPYQNGPYANVQYLDNGNPIMEFRHIYKSMALLEAMGIATTSANTATPSLFPQKRVADLETRRLRKENKRLRVIKVLCETRLTPCQIELARQRRSDTVPLEGDEIPPPPIARSSERVKRRGVARNVEVIDLTGD